MSQRFAPEVHTFIRENVQGRTSAELAALVNAAFGTNFTADTMKIYKGNHKLKSGTPGGTPKGSATKLFPQPVKDYILANYKGVGNKEMAERLNAKFGTSYTMKQLNSYYINHGLNSGLTGRFEKGNISHNKGKKGLRIPGSEKGYFQKGNIPHNKVPIGTVVTKNDGYLWKKVGEGGREWKQLHLILWEEAHGPVPKGHFIIYKDGNRQNCVLENLAMVSSSEHGVLNRCGLRFEHPELTETGILIAKIKIAASKRKRKGAQIDATD